MKRALFWNDQETVKLLNESLDHNAISIVDTDTILGFLGRLTRESYQRLNHIKGGRSGKPYLILLGSSDKLKLFVDQTVLTSAVMRLINHCWPGPVTFIFKAQPTLPDYIVSSEQTIALRCPHHEGLQKLLSLYEGLFSTSANKSSQPVPGKREDIDPDILAEIDYLIMNNTLGEHVIPSTIIDLSGLIGHDERSYDMIKIVREGAYPIEELERIYGSKFKR